MHHVLILLLAVSSTSAVAADEPSYVVVSSVRPEGGDESAVVSYGIKYEDYDRMLATLPTIRAAVPIREMAKEVHAGSRACDVRIVGTTELYTALAELEIDRGRGLTEADNQRYENVAVIGPTVVEALFPDEEPAGKAIKLGSDYYTIVGVAVRGEGADRAAGLLGRVPGDEVLIPLNTARLRFGDRIIVQRDRKTVAEEVQLSRVVLDVGDAGERARREVEASLGPFHPKQDVRVELLTPDELSRPRKSD